VTLDCQSRGRNFLVANRSRQSLASAAASLGANLALSDAGLRVVVPEGAYY